MRNRVAHTTARALRLSFVLALVPVAIAVLTAQTAAAATTNPGQVPFSVAGPVGVGAVIVGVAGVVIGLLRRRKLAATRVVPVRSASPASAVQSVLEQAAHVPARDEQAA